MKVLSVLSLGAFLVASMTRPAHGQLISLNDSGNNNGMSFFGGLSPNTSPSDPLHVYVQIVSDASGTSMPSGFANGNLPQFSGTSSAGDWTFDWDSGGFAAPPPNSATHTNAAFKLLQTTSTATDYVFDVVHAAPAASITLNFTSGAQSGLAGVLDFYRFEQDINDLPNTNNKPITAFAHFSPTADPHGFGPADVALNFYDVGGFQEQLRLLVGTNTVISGKSFNGTVTPVPEPSSMAIIGIGLLVGWRRKRR